MQQSQDIGNVRRELILKALSTQATRTDCPARSDAHLQRELLDGNQTPIQARKKDASRMHDLLISGARVVDRTGAPAITTEVALRDGRVLGVGRALGEAHQVIDADGVALMPGIIDVHTHYDAQIAWDRRLSPSERRRTAFPENAKETGTVGSSV